MQIDVPELHPKIYILTFFAQIYLCNKQANPEWSEDTMHLIITEKHDTAKRIAAILSEKKPKKERISGVDTYGVR